MKNCYFLVAVSKPATLLKSALLYGCFSRFLNCTNGTKSRNATHSEAETSAVSHLYFLNENYRYHPLLKAIMI